MVIQYPRLHQLPTPPPHKSGWPWTAESACLPPVLPNGQPWPKLSIVTPSYNQADFLEATLRSVLLQGYPNLEYIVIDGGSTDNSVDIIRKYEPWLAYWISEPDQGQYQAINKGFAQSTGPVMSWLNSDDMFTPNSLEVVGNIFGSFPTRVNWLTGLIAYWSHHDRLARIAYFPRYSNQLIRLGYYDERGFNTIQQEGTFWRRSLWEQAGGRLHDELKYIADFNLWRAFARYTQLYLVTTVLAGFRVHAAQKTASMSDYFQEIDRCLSKEWPASWINVGLKNPAGRTFLRAYRWLRRDFGVLTYNLRDECWEIT